MNIHIIPKGTGTAFTKSRTVTGSSNRIQTLYQVIAQPNAGWSIKEINYFKLDIYEDSQLDHSSIRQYQMFKQNSSYVSISDDQFYAYPDGQYPFLLVMEDDWRNVFGYNYYEKIPDLSVEFTRVKCDIQVKGIDTYYESTTENPSYIQVKVNSDQWRSLPLTSVYHGDQIGIRFLSSEAEGYFVDHWSVNEKQQSIYNKDGNAANLSVDDEIYFTLSSDISISSYLKAKTAIALVHYDSGGIDGLLKTFDLNATVNQIKEMSSDWFDTGTKIEVSQNGSKAYTKYILEKVARANTAIPIIVTHGGSKPNFEAFCLRKIGSGNSREFISDMEFLEVFKNTKNTLVITPACFGGGILNEESQRLYPSNSYEQTIPFIPGPANCNNMIYITGNVGSQTCKGMYHLGNNISGFDFTFIWLKSLNKQHTYYEELVKFNNFIYNSRIKIYERIKSLLDYLKDKLMYDESQYVQLHVAKVGSEEYQLKTVKMDYPGLSDRDREQYCYDLLDSDIIPNGRSGLQTFLSKNMMKFYYDSYKDSFIKLINDVFLKHDLFMSIAIDSKSYDDNNISVFSKKMYNDYINSFFASYYDPLNTKQSLYAILNQIDKSINQIFVSDDVIDGKFDDILKYKVSINNLSNDVWDMYARQTEEDPPGLYDVSDMYKRKWDEIRESYYESILCKVLDTMIMISRDIKQEFIEYIDNDISKAQYIAHQFISECEPGDNSLCAFSLVLATWLIAQIPHITAKCCSQKFINKKLFDGIISKYDE